MLWGGPHEARPGEGLRRWWVGVGSSQQVGAFEVVLTAWPLSLLIHHMGLLLKQALAGLSPHQERAIAKLKARDRLLLYHGMGSGKTLTGLAAAEQLGLPATVIGPAALRGNFDKEKVKHKVKAHLDYYSYNKPPPPGLYPFVVYDEAQRTGRLESQSSRLVDQVRGDKTLLASGTPIRNEPSELIPVLRALGADVPRDKGAFNKRFIAEREVKPSLWARIIKGVKPGTVAEIQNIDDLRAMVHGKVDYYKPGGQGFPAVRTQDLRVPMTPRQDATYRMVMDENPSMAYKVQHGLPPSKTESRRMNAFLGAARQVANTPVGYNLKADPVVDAPKIEKAVAEIVKKVKVTPSYRGVTYSNFIEAGIDPVAKRLAEHGVPHAKFTGSQTARERTKILDDYDKGRVKHLLISPAGAEGLDLKGVRLMQILEPHWNDARIDQAQARAIRYKSHDHLAPADRSVTVQRYYAQPRPRLRLPFLSSSESDKGVDDYLYMLSKDKSNLNEQFLKVLQQEGRRDG